MNARPWLPAAVLVLGAFASFTLGADRRLPLRAPLTGTISDTSNGYVGTALPITPAELAVAAPDAFLLRAYRMPGDTVASHEFTLYIGY